MLSSVCQPEWSRWRFYVASRKSLGELINLNRATANAVIVSWHSRKAGRQLKTADQTSKRGKGALGPFGERR